jgi:thymidylate synthase
MLGLPFNIASYALLLKLIAREVGMIPGELIGQLADVHIYHSHFEGAWEYLRRTHFSNQDFEKMPHPRLNLLGEDPSIFAWTHDQIELVNYSHLGPIKMEVSI